MFWHESSFFRSLFAPTGLYEQSFGLIPLDSYSLSSFRVSSKTRKRCARVDSPPTVLEFSNHENRAEKVFVNEFSNHENRDG